jgi:hypothetical protein
MRNNQISLDLAMHQMRFFNERPNTSVNNDKFHRRMWAMYPATTAKMVKTPYRWTAPDSKCPPSKSANAGAYHF